MNRVPEPSRALITKARDWAEAKLRGERLPEQELRCGLCGELSEALVCAGCIEIELEGQVHE